MEARTCTYIMIEKNKIALIWRTHAMHCSARSTIYCTCFAKYQDNLRMIRVARALFLSINLSSTLLLSSLPGLWSRSYYYEPFHSNLNCHTLTPVKNQSGCGSCWVHAVLAAVESLMYLNGFTVLPTDLAVRPFLACNRDNNKDACLEAV